MFTITNVTIVGYVSGSVMYQNSCIFDAPSICAASEIAADILFIAPTYIRIGVPNPIHRL